MADDTGSPEKQIKLSADSSTKLIMQGSEIAEEERRHVVDVDVLTKAFRIHIEGAWSRFKDSETSEANISKRWKAPGWLDLEFSDKLQPSCVSLGLLRQRSMLDTDTQIYYKRLCAMQLFDEDKDGMDKCLKKLRTLLADVREYYDESYTRDLSDDQLLEIIFFDGCFIITMLCFGDFCKIISWKLSVVRLSLMEEADEILLFDNQIPLFILQHILPFIDSDLATTNPDYWLNFTFREGNEHWSFVQKYLFKKSDRKNDEFDNLLHLYHHSVCEEMELDLPTWCGNFEWTNCRFFPDPNFERTVRNSNYTATTLVEGGVAFKKRKEYGNISFSSGTLSIPCFRISDPETISLLAFEQYKFNEETSTYTMPITNVVYFIALIVRTSKDLDVLEKCGVVQREATSNTEEILDFFDRVRRNIKMDLDETNTSFIFEAINLFLKSRRSQWWLKLKKDYFSNPWTFISLLAAIVLLFLTCTQTYFTVFPSDH